MPHSISPNPIKDEPMDGDAGIPSDAAPAKTPTDDDADMNDEPQAEAPPAGQAEEVKKEVQLDELFADEDSDEEFPSSAPVKREGASSPARAASPSYVASRPPVTLQRKKTTWANRAEFVEISLLPIQKSCAAFTNDSSLGDSFSSG